MCAFVCCAQPGMIYNLEDGRKALRDVFALQLFDNVQVCFRVLSELCFASAAQSLCQNTSLSWAYEQSLFVAHFSSTTVWCAPWQTGDAAAAAAG